MQFHHRGVRALLELKKKKKKILLIAVVIYIIMCICAYIRVSVTRRDRRVPNQHIVFTGIKSNLKNIILPSTVLEQKKKFYLNTYIIETENRY